MPAPTHYVPPDCYHTCINKNPWCKDDHRQWCDKYGKPQKDYCTAYCVSTGVRQPSLTGSTLHHRTIRGRSSTKWLRYDVYVYARPHTPFSLPLPWAGLRCVGFLYFDASTSSISRLRLSSYRLIPTLTTTHGPHNPTTAVPRRGAP